MINLGKRRCPICGCLLEKYPSNGQPLVRGYVCNSCNNSLIIPIRAFFALSVGNNFKNALLIKSKKAQLIRPSEKGFEREDLEKLLGVEVAIDIDTVPPFCRFNSFTIATLREDWQCFCNWGRYELNRQEEVVEIQNMLNCFLTSQVNPNFMIIPKSLVGRRLATPFWEI